MTETNLTEVKATLEAIKCQLGGITGGLMGLTETYSKYVRIIFISLLSGIFVGALITCLMWMLFF